MKFLKKSLVFLNFHFQEVLAYLDMIEIPGLTDISRGVFLVMLHKFPSESTPCSNRGVYGYSTISELIRETKSESTELELGRNKYR